MTEPKLSTNCREIPRAHRGLPGGFEGFDHGPRVGIEWLNIFKVAGKVAVVIVVAWYLVVVVFSQTP